MLPTCIAALSATALVVSPRASDIRMSAAEIGAVATAWQPAAFERVASSLNLEAKPYAADLGFDSFTFGDTTGAVRSFELSGKESNVAWCSGLTSSGGVDRGSVTVWNGPLTDIPHLTAASGVSDGGVDLLIDFKVRAECAYDPSGEYAEPDSREAFMQGSNRKDFAADFFTEEVTAWADGLRTLDGATDAESIDAATMATLGASPVRVCLRLPLSADAAAAAAAACERAVDLWLSWAPGVDS